MALTAKQGIDSIQLDLATFLGTPEGRYLAETCSERVVRKIFQLGVESANRQQRAIIAQEIHICQYCGTEYGYEETCHDPQCQERENQQEQDEFDEHQMDIKRDEL